MGRKEGAPTRGDGVEVEGRRDAFLFGKKKTPKVSKQTSKTRSDST